MMRFTLGLTLFDLDLDLDLDLGGLWAGQVLGCLG